jgi:predicted O-linked N-acetylglucosamine transferase (SPINDLY family)
MQKTKTHKPVPTAIQARVQQALVLHQQGRLAEAECLLEGVLRHAPKHFGALHLLGVISFQTQRPLRGVELITKAINLNSNVAVVYNDLGNGLRDLKRFGDALANYEKAITLKPDYVEAYHNRGITLKELKRPEEALANYDKAIALKPDYAEAYNNRGVVLRELQRYDEAVASYDKAILLNPDNAEAHRGRGNALLKSNNYAEAPILNEEAFLLTPKHIKVFLLNNFISLFKLKRYERALASYDTAIKLKPDYAEAYNNRGNALCELNRFDDALADYDKAITLKPDYAAVLINRGTALCELNRLEEALASFDKAITLKPDFEFLLGDLIHTKMNICDWSNLDTQIIQLIQKIDHAETVSRPFTLLAATNSPELHKKAAEIYALARYPLANVLPIIAPRQRRKTIHIGYFSADFREQPVSNLAAELFERHDRSMFEVTAISFGPFVNDEMQQRLVVAFDKFIDVRNQSNIEVAMLARKLKIDIAIDLNGFTQGCRTNIFSMRAAPVQVNYLGYSGTMGATYMDYLIADPMLIPTRHQKHYTEKIVYLPNSYMPNDSKRHISNQAFHRAQFELPQSGFVFCCFNNNYKITPEVFDRWMRILKKVEGSVLWLSKNNVKTSANLKKEAGIRGVDQNRLVFATRMPRLADHLARHRLADLFLDTLPYNAHTTASDALWAGLPVLTCIGETFAGRVAASLLNAVGLSELITSTPQAYEALAIELATNPEELATIKRKLADSRFKAPLFDTQLFTKHIETAYTAMYERYQADLPPDYIYVPH